MVSCLPVTGYALMVKEILRHPSAAYQRVLLLAIWLLIVPIAAHATVLTSIRPLGFIAAAIAQGVTSVEVLLPDGHSPHDYVLRPSDLRRLQAAQMVVWIGPEMEIALTKPLQATTPQKQLLLSHEPTVLPLLRGGRLKVDSPRSDTHQGQGGQGLDDKVQVFHPTSCRACAQHHDLHFWLSPRVAKQIAILIQTKLVAALPQHSARLTENLAAFEQQLAHVEQTITEMLAPVRQRPYFVFHDAYRYFELHFGLQQAGYFTLNPVLQPGAQRLHRIREQLKQQATVCLFTEPQFKPAVMETVAQGITVKMGVLDPLGSGIAVTEKSYGHFLTQLAMQFVDCLKE